MLYHAYELQKSWLSGVSALASMGSELLSNPHNPLGQLGTGSVLASALDVLAHATEPRGKPEFGIHTVIGVDGKTHAVREEVVLRKDFGDLRRFSHEGQSQDASRLLIVAPMSGHYATLLRGTVERMLQEHVVYITDWADAKLVPLDAGPFDLDDYIDYVIDFFEFIGPGAHALAVCQPSVPVFAACALMSKNDNPARPKTLTMMGGPIDTREAPTVVNDTATMRPHSWFEQNVICTVPMPHPGAGRRVYPGFLQLSGFMSMNLGNHMVSHWTMFTNLVRGDDESAEATKKFYDEYRSVCDMTADFYLQTIHAVFQEHLLPRGEFMHRGQRIDLGDVHDIAILAIEGEKDDISGLGQTKASLKLTPNLSDDLKKYYMAKNVGHYGIFNGSKWRNVIAPVVDEWIATHNG